MAAAKKEDLVPRPPKKVEYEIRFAPNLDQGTSLDSSAATPGTRRRTSAA